MSREDPAATHFDAIQRMYEDAMERIDHLSGSWGPMERRRSVRVEARDQFDPDLATLDLGVHRAFSLLDPCPEHTGPDAANFVVEPDVVEDRNVTIDEPVAGAVRSGFWGVPLPNKRWAHRRDPA